MGDTASHNGASRRNFLRGAVAGTATLAAGGAIAGRASAASDPLITNTQDWNHYLGEGVDARPYGTPSRFEGHVVRRNVPWLTADPTSSVNFTPLHELEGDRK